MPFVQRVVQPTRLAQVSTTTTTNSANSTLATSKFQCMPGKCTNNNCINSKAQCHQDEVDVAGVAEQQQQQEELSELNGRGKVQGKIECNGRLASGLGLVLEKQSATRVKDAAKEEPYEAAAQQTRIATKAIIHNTETTTTANSHPISVTNGYGENHKTEGAGEVEVEDLEKVVDAELALTNGCSFSYATDNEDDLCHNLSQQQQQQRHVKPQTLSPLKKLKQHVEFMPPISPTHSIVNRKQQQQQQTQHQHQQHQRSVSSSSGFASASKSKTKLVTGYEFESISNITLSNALRQLASLVLLASDIFDDLQRELQSVGERTRTVQRKISAVEQRVTAYDPKLVAVPESDLLTFAQRKTHYETIKTVTTELFSAETRPHSVRVLYENAGRVTPSPTHSQQASACSSAGVSPRSPTSEGILNGTADGGEFSDTGVLSGEELVCTPVFGKANRKMRTRIDAEIEIRLPAAIEDLRKWTSSEALGDVTVTPDCMHHVDTSICTSVIIGDNGILTPALSPSVLSADAVDALYSINSSNLNDLSQIPSDVNKDVPLNHRLPSPEEQCKIIALRYPAEIISVDTSGKRFQRMCLARKSTTGCFLNTANGNGHNANGVENEDTAGNNNLNEDVQTVSRRSRSRKSRGKRRNTLAGIDQKEIQIAAEANGAENNNNAQQANTPTTEDSQDSALRRHSEKTSAKKFARSKSSDILKKESVALPYDKGKNTLTRLNSLKQWGRNRFKFMQRHDNNMLNWSTGKEYGADVDMLNNMVDQKINEQQQMNISTVSNKPDETHKVVIEAATVEMETESNNLESRSEGRFSHERKPSYSSSEKSVSVSSTGQLKGKLNLAASANVKLRDTSTLNRQRRQGMGISGLGGKDEQPHSSSGNWSASSESGRASIGSEITIQPKSSASNTSLNCSSFHAGSGPPSSMMSRRRFLNTSASSSVTSEGTATPELQGDHYPMSHLDDETSSAYSCDTEGYYTSFHMDSGLRTLKEEEPLQNPHANHNYASNGQSNPAVTTAENEYELFGRGSTSTTTSSAGTVCTTLMGNVSAEQSSLSSSSLGPDVPERISSLGKLNKSRESTLERSYSSSTMSSTLERTGTIKRNVNAALSMSAKSAEGSLLHSQQNLDTPESQESEFNFEQRIKSRSAQPLPNLTHLEVECSESSDLEGVERIERMRQKTTLNAKRIPSMCIITPTTSDDDEMIAQNLSQSDKDSKDAYDPERTLTPESSPTLSQRTLNLETEELLDTQVEELQPRDMNLNNIKRQTQNGLNHMLEKLKVVLPNLKSSTSPEKAVAAKQQNEDLYDLAGEYVTIADVGNTVNNNKYQSGIYYANDVIKKKLLVDESSEYAQINESNTRKVEYVSLNELPPLTMSRENIPKIKSSVESASSTPNKRDKSAAVPMYAEISEVNNAEQNNMLNTQPRVRLNAQGKVIYDSDSLKRRKTAHTTFAPGPCVKESESALSTLNVKSESATNVIEKQVATPAKLFLLNGGVAATRKVANVRPIVLQNKSIINNNNNNNNNNINNNNNNMYFNPFVAYQEQKHLLVNQTNPFYQEPLPSPPPAPSSQPSPSTATTRSSNSLESSSQLRESGKSSITATAATTTTITTTTTTINATTSTTIDSKNTTTSTLTTTTTTNTTNTLSSVNVVNNKNNNNNNNTENNGTMANRNNNNNKITAKEKLASNNLNKSESECEMKTTPKHKPQHKSRKNINSICPPTFNENIMPPALPPRLRRALTPTPLPPPPPSPPLTPQTMRSKSLTRNELKEHPEQTERSSSSTISIDPNLQLNAASSPSVLKRVLKRNNSYRLANEELHLEMNKENMDVNTLPHLSAHNDKNVGSSTPQRSIAKSFERLMDQFSLSTTSIDSSYLKNKSLENFDEAGEAFVNNAEKGTETEKDDSESDSDLEFIAPVTNSRYHKSFIENVLLRPFKIIKPHDEGARRQRILKKLEVTEIW